MANVNVNSQTWTQIGITSGTVQNISATADIELSAEQTDNSGVVLKPSELYQWDNETIYARAVTEETGALRVVNFKKAAGGGGGYVLPVATASTLGGVKVGNNLTIDENGVLSGTAVSGGQNYSTTEQQIGTWIDGKPLYQKTLVGTIPTGSDSANTNILVDSAIGNIDIGFITESYIKEKSANQYYYLNEPAVGGNSGSRIWLATEQNAIRGRIDPLYISSSIMVTIKYTKTTD